MFILRQASQKMAVLLHKQAKVPFDTIIAVCDLSLFFYGTFVQGHLIWHFRGFNPSVMLLLFIVFSKRLLSLICLKPSFFDSKSVIDGIHFWSWMSGIIQL